jgi:hypothetical protein
MSVATLTTQVVGYQVRSAGGADVVGEVEGVRSRGMRVYRIPGHHGMRGYVPSEAVLWVAHGTNTIFLAEGITAEQVAGAPPPPDEGPDDWHKSGDWWADLLGHYGLFDSAGMRSEPFLHPAQR